MGSCRLPSRRRSPVGRPRPRFSIALLSSRLLLHFLSGACDRVIRGRWSGNRVGGVDPVTRRGRAIGATSYDGSHMKITAVRAYAAILGLGIAAGCTGQIGELPSGTAGSGSGAGNSTGSGSAGNGASGTAGTGNTGGSAGAVGAGGGAGTDPTGTAGTSGTAHPLDLSGSPQYYRLVRLTNAQWARAVQDVLKLAGAVGSGGELPGRGHRDHRLLQQRAGAGRDPARVVGLPGGRRDAGGAGDRDRRGAPARLQRHRRGGLDLDAGAPRLPPAADRRGDSRPT